MLIRLYATWVNVSSSAEHAINSRTFEVFTVTLRTVTILACAFRAVSLFVYSFNSAFHTFIFCSTFRTFALRSFELQLVLFLLHGQILRSVAMQFSYVGSLRLRLSVIRLHCHYWHHPFCIGRWSILTQLLIDISKQHLIYHLPQCLLKLAKFRWIWIGQFLGIFI